MKKFFMLVLAAFSLTLVSAGPATLPAVNGLINKSATMPEYHGGVFHFAVLADRATKPRPGVFEEALAEIDRLYPDFVMSIGDLIQGETAKEGDGKGSPAMWDELDRTMAKVRPPVFYTPGNHDLRNPLQLEYYQARYGRPYYHFVYGDCLFLVLDSTGLTGKDSAAKEKQVEYVREALAANRNVRWTFVFIHHPFWNAEEAAGYPRAIPSWQQIQPLLKGRKCTVFAGHTHKYGVQQIDGNTFYTLATTGGAVNAKLHSRQFDHFLWVAMTPEGPRISNLMVAGICGDDPMAERDRKPGVCTMPAIKKDAPAPDKKP